MATNNIFDIKINEEYVSLVPPLSTSEYHSLKEDINKNGVQIPIVTNQHGDILDGHHRYKIWVVDLGRPVKEMPKPTVLNFNNKLHEKIFVINVNLKRRHLNDFQQIELALKTKLLLEEIAKFNSKANLKQNKTVDSPSEKNFPVGRVNEEIGKHAGGKSYKTVGKVETILKQAPQELIDKARHGQITINLAHQMVKRSKDHQNTPELPQGQFDIILADPPWTYEFPHRGNPQDHYQTMSLDDIKALQVPSADNAILFLWTTIAKLVESLEVMKNWGFTYRSHIVWAKDKIGLGYYVRGQHELLLIGKKGNETPTPAEANRPRSIFQAPRGRHSEKPELVYDIVEKMYPNRKYLELFARNKRPGWTAWGNEVIGAATRKGLGDMI
jgi:N6-adenosine-specific RNA methylase IME4